MLLEEARWVGSRLASFSDEELFPLLNVGSSTETFRSVTQPHIDREIFSPLAKRGGSVQHVDMKDAPGVDIVGDLYDRRFITDLRARVFPRSIMVSNLLEHVLDPARVAESLASIVQPGGLIIVSGPRSYPYHPDPIDNRFRPSVEEVHALFPGTGLLEGDIVVSDTWRPWRGGPRAIDSSAIRYFARLALPLYRPRAWRQRVDSIAYLFRGVSAYALLLTKEGPRVARDGRPRRS